MSIKDDKLEQYITRIKESNNSNNKLLNYRKAINRLDELKKEYNNLCSAVKPKNIKKENIEKVSIEKIISALNKINKDLEGDSCDILTLIDNYIQYRTLMDNLELENEKFKNEILKVEQYDEKIIINKIELEDIL